MMKLFSSVLGENSNWGMTGSQQALSLYRQLLRKGKQLRFTDKEYYFKRIRAEFEKKRNLSDASEIEHNIQVNLETEKEKHYVNPL